MIRIAVAAAVLAAALSPALAQKAPPAPKADCKMFKRLSDGRWTSTITSKVGNPKSFVVLQPGLPIDKSLVVVGMNVSDTIDKLCGGN